MKNQNNSDNKNISLRWLIFLTVVIFIVLSSPVLLFIDNWTDRGTFGDMFGGVNALFSGLAFAGIIYTIFLQKKELALQREELKLTRKEFKEQNITLRKQRFENTFFSLVNQHEIIIDNIDAEINMHAYRNREIFHGLFIALRNKLNNELIKKGKIRSDPTKLSEFHKRYVVQFSDELFKETQAALKHYFQSLYNLMKFVYLSDQILQDEKDFYFGIIRAHLSTFELIMIYYNAMLPGDNYRKFQYLVKKTAVLKNLDASLIIHESNKILFSELLPSEYPSS